MLKKKNETVLKVVTEEVPPEFKQYMGNEDDNVRSDTILLYNTA